MWNMYIKAAEIKKRWLENVYCIKKYIKKICLHSRCGIYMVSLRRGPGWWGVSWWVCHEDSSTGAQSPPCEPGASSSQWHSKLYQSSPLDRSAFRYSTSQNYYTFQSFCQLWTQQNDANSTMVFDYKILNIATHRFSTRTGGKHLPNTGGSTHDPWAVTQHEDQLFNVSRSKCPVLTRRQRHQFNPLHHLSYSHHKYKSYFNNSKNVQLLVFYMKNSIPSSSIWNSKPFFLKMSMFSMRIFSLTAVRWSFWGLQKWCK